MGCWHGTCGLSQLPIKAGEKTALFIIVERGVGRSGSGGGFCYSNDIYTPTSIPIFGKYNDYGSLEEIEHESGDIVFKQFLDKITDGSCIVKAGRFKEDKAIPENIEELLSMIQESRISVKKSTMRDTEFTISYMLIHKNIYDDVLAEMGNRTPYEESFTMREYWEKQFTKLEVKIENLNEKIKLMQVDETNKDNLNYLQTKLRLLMRFSDSNLQQACNDFGLTRGDFKNMISENISNENTSFKNGIIDLLLMHTIFNYARKVWMPQSGAGSQSEEKKIHEVIAKGILKNIEEYKTVVLEDGEYTPEEIENLTRETLWASDEDEDEDED